MRRAARLLLPLLLLAPLTACLTDPFGVKPEVRGVKLPEKAPADPAAPAEDAEAPEAQP